MKRLVLLLLSFSSLHAFAQPGTLPADSTVVQVSIPFEFTSEEDNKLIKEDDSVNYYVASGNVENIVCINEELSYYKLLNKEHKVIAEGAFIIEGEKYLQQGKWTARFDNGKLKTTGYYDRNNPIGTWHTYYSNGKLKAICNYAIIADNRETYTCLSGSYQEFYQNGKLKVNGFYQASVTKVEEVLMVDDPVTGTKVNKIFAHNTYRPEKAGHWDFYNESGELDKKEEN